MMKRTRKPTHPGAIIRKDIMPELGINQTELAQQLGVSRLTVSELIHEKRAVSTDMALRLAYLLNTTPESWLNMQQAVDLWELVHAKPGEYKKIKSIAA